MLEQLLQAALGTVLMQIAVDVVDVLNSRREFSPFQLVVRLPRLLLISWLDAPLFQIGYHSLYCDIMPHSWKKIRPKKLQIKSHVGDLSEPEHIYVCFHELAEFFSFLETQLVGMSTSCQLGCIED